MKIALIYPPGQDQGGFSNAPLCLLYLAGTLRSAGYTVDIIDGYTEGWTGLEQALTKQYDIVGITIYSQGRYQALKCAQLAKESGAIVIMGGAHATLMWKQLLNNYPYIDICVLGEGELTLLDIVSSVPTPYIQGIAYRNNGIAIRTPQRPLIPNLDAIPFPSWDLVNLDKYPGGSGFRTTRGQQINLSQVRVPLVMSRGCLGSCQYCSSWHIWRTYRARSGKNIADEVEVLVDRGYYHFVFEDDAFSQNRQTVMDFCREIVERKLYIGFFATTTVSDFDYEMAQALREAGCYAVSFGIESADPTILKRIHKQQTVEQAHDAIVAAQRAGLDVCALMMVGNPGETNDSIKRSIEFLQQHDIHNIGTVGCTWVFPGTALHNYAKRKGYIDESFWLNGPDLFPLMDGWDEFTLQQWHNSICNVKWLE